MKNSALLSAVFLGSICIFFVWRRRRDSPATQSSLPARFGLGTGSRPRLLARHSLRRSHYHRHHSDASRRTVTWQSSRVVAGHLELEPFGSLQGKAFWTLFMISHRRVSSRSKVTKVTRDELLRLHPTVTFWTSIE